MKRTGFMAVVAAGVAMLFASSASALDKITVAYFLEWPTANQVAQLEKTYDEAMGVEVEWRAFGNGNEMSQAMVSGDVQIAYSQGLVPWVVAVTNGLPLKLVGVAVSYAEADNCVVHADTGITQANAKRAGRQADRDARSATSPTTSCCARWITSASTPPRSTWCR